MSTPTTETDYYRLSQERTAAQEPMPCANAGEGCLDLAHPDILDQHGRYLCPDCHKRSEVERVTVRRVNRVKGER